MSFKALVLFAGAAMGHTIRNTKFGCGTPEPSAEHKEISRQFGLKEAALRKEGLTTQADINVNVYLHSVASTDAALLTDDVLQQQFDVLAADFGTYGISMTFAGSTKTVNQAWSTDAAEMEMKSSLRAGSYADLNIYLQEDLGGNLGYCYFPTDAPEGSDAFTRDGCSVLASSVPGGASEGYNLGKTAVHEAGHWFGLYHTFEAGCSGNGDEIADTPAQDSPSSGCPTGRDSCPNLEGLDPIHNFMDYSDDACYEEFTAGQQERINSFWTNYRA